MERMYNFVDYVDRLLGELDIPGCQSPSEETHLFDELGFDSLATFEMLIVTESMARMNVSTIDGPLPPVPLIFTLGDAYHYYLTAVEFVKRNGEMGGRS